jgi:hypothetical protein
VSAFAGDALRNGGLAVLATIASLAGFEGAIRMLGMHFPGIPVASGTREVAWVYDARLGWRNRPRFAGYDSISGPDQGAVHINSLGLRGGELAAKRGPRVAVFGDSFVFGTGVDEEHVFTTHLERLLRRRRGDYDVINLGVNGFSTDQELLLFQEMADRLRPDVVILVMCDNDFNGNLQDFVFRRYYKPFFTLSAGALSVHNQPVPHLSRGQEAKVWLGQRSEAWNFFRSRTWNGRPAFGFFQVGLPRAPTEDPIELMANLTRAFHDLAGARGAHFATFNAGQVGEYTPLFQSLRPRLVREGIAFLGLEGHLAEGRQRHPDLHWDFGTDRHWNRAAHRLAAGIVYNFLEGKGWVAGAPLPPTETTASR